MAIVAGVDFGTLSVRVAIVDSEKGRLGSAIAEYPLQRTKDDPDHATQSHSDHIRALSEAMQQALQGPPATGQKAGGFVGIPVERGPILHVSQHVSCPGAASPSVTADPLKLS